MNLHRSGKQPQWQSVAPAERTLLQRIAHSTNGILTPGNIITVLGLSLVVCGLYVLLRGDLAAGLILVMVGRLLDIADGALAEATQTKSPLGELFDAAADKIGTILALIALIVSSITPLWVVTVLAAPQLIILAIVFWKRRQGGAIQPSRAGKISMALVWVSIVGLCAGSLFKDQAWIFVLAYVAVASSALLGVYAAWCYAKSQVKAI